MRRLHNNNLLRTLSFTMGLYFFITKNDENILVPSMVLTTLQWCVLLTFYPQSIVLWMAASN